LINGLRHCRIDHAINTVYCFVQRQSERPCNIFLYGLQGRVQIKRKCAVTEKVRIQVPHEKIRVCSDRTFSTTTIANWSRICSRTLWSNSQYSTGVDPNQGPSAGSNSMNIQHRQGHPIATDFAFLG